MNKSLSGEQTAISSSNNREYRSADDVESPLAILGISPTPSPRLLPSLRFRPTKSTSQSAPAEAEGGKRPSIYIGFRWHQYFFKAQPSPNSKETTAVSERAGTRAWTSFLGPYRTAGCAPASAHGMYAAKENNQHHRRGGGGGSGRGNGSSGNRSRSTRGRFKFVGKVTLVLVVCMLALDLYMACWARTSATRRSGGLASGMLSLDWNRVADNGIGGGDMGSPRTYGLEGNRQERQGTSITEPLGQDPYDGQRVAVVVPYVGRDLPVWWDVFAEQARLNHGLIDWLIFCDQVT